MIGRKEKRLDWCAWRKWGKDEWIKIIVIIVLLIIALWIRIKVKV